MGASASQQERQSVLEAIERFAGEICFHSQGMDVPKRPPRLRCSEALDRVVLQCMKWGLIPSFTKKTEKPDLYRMFNARSESLREKAKPEEAEGDKDASMSCNSRRKPKEENDSLKGKSVCHKTKSSFAAIVVENTKLVYLRQSLVQELSKDPEAFLEKVTGSFVRVKTDPQKYHIELLQVMTGAKRNTSENRSGEMTLLVSNMPTEIRLSSLIDGDITEVLVRDGNKVSFEEPNPFAAEGEEVASAAYKYRRWNLAEDMYLVARCEVQSVVDVNNQRSFLTLNALNEFDPKYSGVDWRQKLETQHGAVLATELKNNANKLAKWTAQSLL